MTGRIIAVLVVIVVVVAGAWYFLAGPGTSTANASPGTPSSTSTPAVTVDYTDQGFSPGSVTVNQGDTVEWVNDSSENLWVAVGPHPLHDGYDGTTLAEHCAVGYQGPTPFDECAMLASGHSWAFTFDRVGTWTYHNHADDAMTGTVTVLAGTSTSSATTTSAGATTSVNVSL
ncbi:MAG: cupredoxin domain-containing protein [Minisyncoccia bacterium]